MQIAAAATAGLPVKVLALTNGLEHAEVAAPPPLDPAAASQLEKFVKRRRRQMKGLVLSGYKPRQSLEAFCMS